MFAVTKRLIGDVEPIFYKKPTEEESYLLGEALKESAGALTKAAGTDRPLYICAGPVNGAGLLPVLPVLPTTVWQAACDAQLAAGLVGSKVTLAADGLSLTATTTGGVFTVLSTDGAAKSVVTGRFE